MSDKIYDELAMERSIKEHFGVDLDVRQAILFHSPVSRTAEATLFLTGKKQLYLYVEAQSKLLLCDIKKIVSRMVLKPEIFFPPKGRPLYFDEIGQAKFREVFPGRVNVTAEDLIFYRTLAPYSPALILISEVKNGEIFQYDTDSTNNWRVGAKFTYRRIKTS